MIATSNVKAGAFGLAVVVLLLCLPDRGHADTESVPNTGIVTQGQTGDNMVISGHSWSCPTDATCAMAPPPTLDLGQPIEWLLSVSVGPHAVITLRPNGVVDIPKGVTYTHAARCFWNAVSAEGLHGPAFPKERCGR